MHFNALFYVLLGGDKAQINRHLDIGHALSSFNDYTSRNLFTVDKDTTQLLTGEVFEGGEAGIAVPATVCTTKSVGISVDINTYEPHLLAGKFFITYSIIYFKTAITVGLHRRFSTCGT